MGWVAPLAPKCRLQTSAPTTLRLLRRAAAPAAAFLVPHVKQRLLRRPAGRRGVGRAVAADAAAEDGRDKAGGDGQLEVVQTRFVSLMLLPVVYLGVYVCVLRGHSLSMCAHEICNVHACHARHACVHAKPHTHARVCTRQGRTPLPVHAHLGAAADPDVWRPTYSKPCFFWPQLLRCRADRCHGTYKHHHIMMRPTPHHDEVVSVIAVVAHGNGLPCIKEPHDCPPAKHTAVLPDCPHTSRLASPATRPIGFSCTHL